MAQLTHDTGLFEDADKGRWNYINSKVEILHRHCYHSCVAYILRYARGVITSLCGTHHDVSNVWLVSGLTGFTCILCLFRFSGLPYLSSTVHARATVYSLWRKQQAAHNSFIVTWLYWFQSVQLKWPTDRWITISFFVILTFTILVHQRYIYLTVWLCFEHPPTHEPLTDLYIYPVWRLACSPSIGMCPVSTVQWGEFEVLWSRWCIIVCSLPSGWWGGLVVEVIAGHVEDLGFIPTWIQWSPYLVSPAMILRQCS